MKTELSKKQKELNHQESIIQDGLKSFQFVGEALRKIRDEQLYVEEFETFENYCKSRWNFPRQRAYQLIETSETACAMSKIFDTTKAKTTQLPVVESHAAALSHCADDNETRAKVWKAVVEDAGGKPITAAAIKKKADEILPPKVDGHKGKHRPPKPVKDSPEIPPEREPGDDTELEAMALAAPIPKKSTPQLDGNEIASAEGKLNEVRSHLDEARKCLDKFMQDGDALNKAQKIKNHKFLVQNFRLTGKDINTARESLKSLSGAWASSKK